MSALFTRAKEGTKAARGNDRETVESIVVAVILAFLFRGFVAEAFVIPTGSMAPTLRGRHMDIKCPECGYSYRTGASVENFEDGRIRGEVTRTTCPICRFQLELDKENYPNERSFNGDRILVSKFAYDLSEPQRWDVIVFKYPGNAKQNYIKRLVGLPGETILIRHGDVFDKAEAGEPQILRKPPGKLKAMLQLVDDTAHWPLALRDIGWPSRWQPSGSGDVAGTWQVPADIGEADSAGYTLQAGAADAWLRYRHLHPRPNEWESAIQNGEVPARVTSGQGELITDYYDYNDFRWSSVSLGTAWVGDLALEGNVIVHSDSGELLLDLVEGGAHFECRIDVASGQAALSIREADGQARPFVDVSGQATTNPKATTNLQGPGKYRVRFANCDDELTLWINEKVVRFDVPATYRSPPDVMPQWSPTDAGDMAPLAIGGKDIQLSVTRLRVLRDKYYLARDYRRDDGSEYNRYVSETDLEQLFSDPSMWSTTPLFAARRSAEFTLGEDQFFPLGDNSPESKDARLWPEVSLGEIYPRPFVERDVLFGKALIVYWPHGWRPTWPWLADLTRNLAFIPNFPQMKLIR